MAKWEYARFEYKVAGTLGDDKFMDWDAVFHSPQGPQRWGTDERFDDLFHLNKLGEVEWEVYHRSPVYMHNEPHRLYSVTYSLRRLRLEPDTH